MQRPTLIPVFSCLVEKHDVDFFRKQFRGFPDVMKIWFVCNDCKKQSHYLYPSDFRKIKLADLHEEHRPKLPYFSENEVQYESRKLNAPKPEPVVITRMKRGMYECLDDNHRVKFYYWSWKSNGYTRYWFECYDCGKSSNWIHTWEFPEANISLMERKQFRPGKTGWLKRLNPPRFSANDTQNMPT